MFILHINSLVENKNISFFLLVTIYLRNKALHGKETYIITGTVGRDCWRRH